MKYMGSKRRIAKDLCDIMNKIITKHNIKTYIEPFVGGANVIEFIKCDNKVGGDDNEYLIALWKSLQKGYQPLEFISREDYYDIKLNKDKYSKEVVALCGIMASYNGNWFRAYGGYSATKTGKDRNFYDEGIRGLMKQVPDILDIDFIHCDYKQFSDKVECLIYCDIPYDNTDKAYKGKKFNHIEFWDWVRVMSKNNIMIVSEFNAPEDFICIYEKQLQKTHANQQNKSTEKLFIHKCLKSQIT